MKKRTNPVVVAASFMFDYVPCEACGKRIRKGQRIQRWLEGIRTHETCR